MKLLWPEIVSALGESEALVCSFLFAQLDGVPVVSETPDEYCDPLGKTRYYKFLTLGLEFGVRLGVLSHVHFYMQPHEGYLQFVGGVLGGLDDLSYRGVVNFLGLPPESREGKHDALVGYIYKWAKYCLNDCSVRFEFDKNDVVRKITLMAK